MKYCKENSCRGHVALKTGRFPPIKDRETFNRRMDGKIVNGREKSYCTILTNFEEQSIVNFVKNKNRCMLGLSKKELEKLILDVLR